MTTVNVKITRANFLVTNDRQNFIVEEHPYDLKSVVGCGPTLELALNDFEAWYSVRYDKEIKAIIVNQNF